ncbi:MAG: RluA family pseudouridine synthase [Clostridia bacterium]|nr:RluA family pseudouridine synthase [Clostridia bacterium]NCC44123.1 RluA family pseudouridine synthase [Clostridia bacterium]
MDRTFNFVISCDEENLRIGDFLVGKGFSRHVRTFLKHQEGAVLLNGEAALFYFVLHEGDRLTVHLVEEEASSNIVPVQMDVDIVYEDEDLMIVNKAADMPIHPSIGNYDNTLANGIAWYFASQGIPFVYRCINRLDRDTTGLLILAKNMVSGAILSEQMKRREIHRTYLAIVEGLLPDQGIVDAPIARTSDSLIERMVDKVHGERAVTHYSRVAYQNDTNLSLAKLRLETGRTHQIRVHMTHIGHPLVGDSLYNPSTILLGRQALHSCSLKFTHPITGKMMDFFAPLPKDMAAFFPDVVV